MCVCVQLKLLGVTETDLSPATSPKKENKYSATKDVDEGEDSKAADAGSDAHASTGIECVLCRMCSLYGCRMCSL
jgi:hypothetical protein